MAIHTHTLGTHVEVHHGKKATRITVEYEDGSIQEAIGDDASKIMQHWISCEVICSVHGMEYNGPTLKRKNENGF